MEEFGRRKPKTDAARWDEKGRMSIEMIKHQPRGWGPKAIYDGTQASPFA
jgi:hypothetical protein